jgi:hypothetical protein
VQRIAALHVYNVMAPTKPGNLIEQAPAARQLSECVPGWPLEWVSAKGLYRGDAESLVLIHFTAVQVEHDSTQKSLLLTAKDRRRRSWSTILTLPEGPDRNAIETEIPRRLNMRLADVGAAQLPPAAASAPQQLASVSVLKARREQRAGRKRGQAMRSVK